MLDNLLYEPLLFLTKKVLEDILLSKKTVSRVVSTIGVQRMDEISLKSMLMKLISPFKKLFRRLKLNNKSIDGLNSVLNRMVNKKRGLPNKW